MRSSVLFILLCTAKRTLATCSAGSTTSFSSRATSTSKSSTSFSFSTGSTEGAAETTEGETSTHEAETSTPGPQETQPPEEEGGGGGGDFPFPFLSPTAPLGLLPLVAAGMVILIDYDKAWNDSYTSANATVANSTMDDKVKFVTGIGYHGGPCSGNVASVGDFSGLCIQDSALGVGMTDFVTVFPSGINTAATWQRSLFRARGVAMGQEHRGKGVNTALSPMVNLGRVPNGGVNWEGFGADPFLVSAAAYDTILGLQSAGVQAVAKNFINNEQETQHTHYSSNVDDRTQHEIYAAPFLRSIMAGVSAIMCSSNLVNGTYACENNNLLNGMLKGEFGFRGFVMSDWYATHSTTSAVNGLDMTMPGDITPGSGTSYFGASLATTVKKGAITEQQLDDMVTRILAAWYFLQQNSSSYPKPNFDSFKPFDTATNQNIDVQADHDILVRQIDAASAILLKNVNGTLPLKRPRSLVLIGSDAGPARKSGPNKSNNQPGVDGILAMGWEFGSASFPYLVSPYEALQARARADQTTISWFFNDFDLVGAASAAMYQDVAIVFLQSDSGDDSNTVDGNTGDRGNLTAWNNGDQLVQAVAEQNNNTIVVVHSVGPLIVEPWIDNPNVTALIWAGLGGTETGNALVDVLYGAVNPSGRLPYTIAKSPSDYPATLETGGTGTSNIEINYSEGLFIDYRHFDGANIAPRYEFGFGLSYTQFKYDNLSIVQNVIPNDTFAELGTTWGAGKPVTGASAQLWFHIPRYNVTFMVENTGAIAGTEIPQVYLHFPMNAGEPPSVLRGFSDIELQPREGQSVTITLSYYDLSIWDIVNQSWMRANGTYSVSVGASSRDFRLNGNVPLFPIVTD